MKHGLIAYSICTTLLIIALYTGKLLIPDMPATIKVTAQSLQIQPDNGNQLAQGGY